MILASKLEWGKALYGFSEKIIDATIDEIAKNFKFAPSIAEFLETAKAVSKKDRGGFFGAGNLLEQPDRSNRQIQNAVALRSLADIKRKLGRKYTEMGKDEIV